jgi:O-antigen/teichoic acid export membrane protein
LVCNVMGTTLVAVGDSNKPLIINTFNALVSLLGSIFLIPPFRIIGAAVANTIGTTLADLRDATYLKPFALFGGWSLLVFIIKPELFLIKILFLIIFIAASFFLRIITRAELELLLAGSGALNWKLLQRFGAWVTKQ